MTTRRDENQQPEQDTVVAEDEPVVDPAGRPTPYVAGPTGPAPISSELRGDPGAEGDNDGGDLEDGGIDPGRRVRVR